MVHAGGLTEIVARIGTASVTALEPVPVTAKRVLEALENTWDPGAERLYSYTDAARVASMFGVTGD